MSRRVKWGVLGYAWIAREAAIPVMMNAPNAEFYAIASKDQARLRACAERFDCSKAYSSYDELLTNPDVEAVYVPLPNSMHKEWSIRAARQGKRVLCKKPIVLTVRDCREMVDVCRENKVRLMEGFMYRYTDRTRKMCELLNSYIVGEIRHIDVTNHFLLSAEDRPPDVRMLPELGGGSVYDVGCYAIDFVAMVMKSKPVAVAEEFVMWNGVDVSCSAVLEYERGALATIACGLEAFRRRYAVISGTKGVSGGA